MTAATFEKTDEGAVEPKDDLTHSIQDLAVQAGKLVDHLDGKSTANSEAIRAELESYKTKLTELLDLQKQQTASFEDKVKAAVEAEVKSARKFTWDVTPKAPGVAGIDNIGDLARTIVLARKGHPDSQRLLWEHEEKAKAFVLRDTKAIGETTNTAGGYLVFPQYMPELVPMRRATAPLLNYVRNIPVRTNLLYIPTQTGIMTVAWTAENATKTSSDETIGQIAVNIFTLAGIAKVSNQLLEDSAITVDAIVRDDFTRGLNVEMDRVVINGSGTGQSTGILNTAGITTTPATNQTAATIYDDLLAAVARVQANYYGNPDTIVMAPRTWSKMLTAKDSAGRYIGIGTVVGAQQFELPGMPTPTGANDAGTGIGGGQVQTVFGFPVVIDANVPIAQTVGANTNRSSIIVGAMREAWMFTRDEIRMDVSNEAGTSWESNQTWFRAETRMGFTAARYPTAWQIISDEGP
jgi:HK97 family phage major capsid protein